MTKLCTFCGDVCWRLVSALLDLSLPRFPAKAINSEVMKLALEPEQGGGPITREGWEAPSRGGEK